VKKELKIQGRNSRRLISSTALAFVERLRETTKK